MNTQDFKIAKERSISRGWLYTITHPDWTGKTPSFAIAERPTTEAFRGAIEAVINEHTRVEITKGFRYDFGDGNGMCRVWLSSENQTNYAAYLKAVELGAQSITLKVENGDGVVCYPDIMATDYAAFYLALVEYINGCIKTGWHQKDAIDYALLSAAAEVL